MTYREAVESAETKPPPVGLVVWRCSAGGPGVSLRARTWFEARATAAAIFGCELEEVEVEKE